VSSVPSTPTLSALSGRFHPQFRDKNRRGIGKSQSIWTDSKMERPAHTSSAACPRSEFQPSRSVRKGVVPELTISCASAVASGQLRWYDPASSRSDSPAESQSARPTEPRHTDNRQPAPPPPPQTTADVASVRPDRAVS
jgi:hypothetical protein